MVKNTYTYAVGRRKTSTATIKLFSNGTGEFNIVRGEKKVDIKTFFGGHKYLYEDALYPLYVLGNDSVIKYNAEIIITGGGLRGQAEAIRLAFARALSEGNSEIRTQIKPYGLLKRDPRRKERKKPGLKGARRAPQWSKR